MVIYHFYAVRVLSTKTAQVACYVEFPDTSTLDIGYMQMSFELWDLLKAMLSDGQKIFVDNETKVNIVEREYEQL